MPPTLSIVIPAYKALPTIEPLADALSALEPVRNGAYEVIVTDDASPDGSAAKIEQRWPLFRVVTGERNLGFGGNVNRGVEAAGGEHLAVVNTDVELRGDPFPPLLDTLAQGHIFAAMPLIYNTALDKVENLARLYCRRGLCWHTDVAEQEEWSEYARQVSASTGNAPRAAQSSPIQTLLCGACFVCRTAQFRQLGGFDPRYRPYYWEDVDLGYRAIERGQVCVTVPDALVVHRHSETIGSGDTKLRHLRLNQARFILAHKLTLAESGLRHPRWWWLARSLRELARGDLQLAGVYFRGVFGIRA